MDKTLSRIEHKKAVERAENIANTYASDLTNNEKRSAFAAMLKYLGDCPEFYRNYPQSPSGPEIAKNFQGHDEKPIGD